MVSTETMEPVRNNHTFVGMLAFNILVALVNLVVQNVHNQVLLFA